MNYYVPLRAFNYETRPTISCKQLPWVGDGDNAEVKRNVNCDLYEKKGLPFTIVIYQAFYLQNAS